MGELKIEEWTKLIEHGVKYKEDYSERKEWDKFRQYYRGYFPSDSDMDLLPFNLTYAMARTIIPNIYFRNPYINLTPRYKPNVDPATARFRSIRSKVVEAMDNWLMKELSIKKSMKMMALDAYLCGVSFAKVGYDSQYGFSPDMVEQGLGDATLSQLDKKKKEIIEYNVSMKPGFPWVQRVPPDYIIVPYGTENLYNCSWIDHMVLRPLDDVKKDSKYKNVADLKGTHADVLFKDDKRNFYKKLTGEADWVEIHELRSAKTKEVQAMVMGHEKWLRPPEPDVLQIDGLPFVSLTFNDDPEFIWAVGDASLIEPQQLEMNEARTQAMYHRRIALLKIMAQKNGIDKSEVDKLLSSKVAPLVFTNGNPKEVVELLQPHIPPDLLAWHQNIRDDVRETLGMGRLKMGDTSRSSRRTATESMLASQGAELRLDERRDAMADCLTEVMRKVNQIVFKFWDQQHVIQVLGVDAAKYWVKYKPSEIIDEYDFNVDVESMSPTTKRMKRQEMLQAISMLAKHPSANVDMLIRMLMREFDWADAMGIMPEAQQTAQQPMSMQEFGQQQQGIIGSPGGARAAMQKNLGGGR